LRSAPAPSIINFPDSSGLGYEELSEEPQDEAVDTFLAGVMSVNPEFNTDVTARLQSGDPIAVEAALTSYNDSALEYVQTSDEWAGTLKDDGTGTANCLVIPLAVAVALVVAVVSTRIVTYVGPGARGGRAADDNRLTRQDASAAIAMTIHS
jgi:SdpC family antimicrobial peptide